MAWFLNGKKRSFRTALGIPYGILLFEDCQPIDVLDLVKGQNVLSEGVERKLITPAEAKRLKTQMTKAGLARNMACVVRLAVAAKKTNERSDDQTPPTYVFKVCTSCPMGTHLAHGYIQNAEGVHKGVPITQLDDGFGFLDQAVSEGKMSASDAIAAFQAMCEAGLARDEAEFKKRHDALPPGTLGEMPMTPPPAALLKLLEAVFEGGGVSFRSL